MNRSIMATSYVLVLLFVSGYYCNSERPLVTTRLGAISGYHKTSYNGRKFAAFEGIPYAKPPIGDRRFEEPEPIEPWHGTWNATLLTTCPQTSIVELNATLGIEDCLYVNVYVPREKPNPDDKLEVVVHIHGGAYMYGSGHAYNPPERPMDNDIIFITFNYRLGIFGFLSTEDSVVPGNNGLKDQALALKWIKNNIASFGGNPDSITLTGMSAGASSVHMHYFSEQSKGLFHRGFSQSGLALNPWSIAEEPLNKAKKLGIELGCPTDSTTVLVECLKGRPQDQILDKMSLFFGYKTLPLAPFGPVVENGGTEPFLKEHPYVLLQKGQVLDVPWILSLDSQEGLLFVYLYFRDAKDFNDLDVNWDEIAPSLLDFNYTLPQSAWKATSDKIREHYLGKEKISKDNMMKLIQIFSDRLFFSGSDEAALLQSRSNKSPVYFYIFGYPGDNNKFKAASHGDEMIYMFGNAFPSPRMPLTSNEVQMKNALWDLVVSYAKTGEPTIAGVQLEATKPDILTYHKINGFKAEDITLESSEELTDRKFWNDLQFNENENLYSKNKDEL